MQPKSVELQSRLEGLTNSFLQLSHNLSEATQKLEQSLIPPALDLAEHIANKRQDFEDLRRQAVELAQSLEVSTTELENIISIHDLEAVLKAIHKAEVEEIIDTRQQALDILEKILKISSKDSADFLLLEQYLTQASQLRNLILNNADSVLNAEVKALISGEHHLVQLLTLILERESPDYQRLANLQASVVQSCGMPIAIAALTGKLFLESESKFINEETLTTSEPIEPGESSNNPVVQEPTISEQTETKSHDYKEIKEEEKPTDSLTNNKFSAPSNICAKAQIDAQEIAGSLLKSNLQDNEIVIQNLILKLINNQKLSLAFNLAWDLEREFPNFQVQLPSWMIRAVILGHHVRYELGTGEIANILMDDFANFNNSLFTHEGEWNQTISLLLAASALRPALLAPNTDASQILLSLRLGEGLNQLYEYCQIIASYGSQRLALDVKAIKTVISEEEWNHKITALNQEIDGWCSDAPGFPMRSTQGRRIWKKWLEPDGLINQLLSQIKEKNSSLLLKETTLNQVQEVKQQISTSFTSCELRNQIELTKRQLGVNRQREIDQDDIPKIYRYVNQAVDFCRRWIDLQELRLDQGNDFTQRQAKLAEKIKQELSNLHEAVLEEIKFFESRNSSILIQAGISCCRAAVLNIQNLFDPNTSLTTTEADPKYLIYADLLRIPSLSLNENWIPEISDHSLVQGILDLIDKNNFDWRQNFINQSEFRNHEATEKILEYVRLNSELSINLEELERMREESLRECQDSLVRDIKETRNQIEQAVALGILKEADRFDYVAQITHIEKEVEITLRFDLKHKNLECIKTAITQKKQVAIEQVRQRLNTLSLTSEQPSYIRIQELLNQGNVLTANEYIDMIYRGDEIPNIEVEVNNFSDFFPIKVTEIDNFMEVNNPPFFIQKVQKRENVCGINLRRPSGSATNRAAEMLTAWFSVKKGGKSQQISQEEARTILVNLGFNPSDIKVEQMGGRTWLQVTTETIRNKELCPVAGYGSAAHGQYRILCVWERPTAEDIQNAVGETSHGTPAFVFFFGRLREPRRRDLARLCRERRRTFVLIDDILMLYLCGAEEPRLQALFNCALPFTFVEPYATTAGLVPPEIFYGRKQERDSIINRMGSCFIYGGRQLGKTALLRSVERDFHAPQEQRIALFLDLKADGIGIHRPIEDMWNLLAEEFKKLEIISRNITTNIGAEGLLRNLETWLEQDKSRRILLLLDETDKFLESDGQNHFSQTSRFKGLMDKTERRFKVVFAGLHNVQRTTRLENHPLAHYGEPLCIGPLLENGEWREARALIKRPLGSIGYELSDDLVTRILSQTNYYPSLIQLYCQELLRDVNKNHLRGYERNNTPPYKILDHQVDEAYKSKNLRKAIRDRFLWTLQLDQRYEVIAYSIAYESLTSQEGMVNGFSVRSIQDVVLSWWSEGFQGKSTDEFRALLEEMVGLGILRETTEGKFALRSPNVVLLLGTEAEIEEQLLSSREPSLDYDAEIFRSVLRNDLSRPSPLTVQQESALRKRENGVSIIVGCPAAGLHELKHFLVSAVGQEFWIEIDQVSETTAFTKLLGNIDKRERNIDGTTIVFVSSTCNWTKKWVETAQAKLQKLTSKRSFVRVIFVANPQKLWELVSSESLNLLVSQGISLFSLNPWHDAALRQWLENCDLALSKEKREKITEITGNWSVLLQRFYQLAKSSHHCEPHLQKLAESLTQSDVLGQLAGLMGLDQTHSQQRQILHALVTLEIASCEELITVLDGVSPETINQTFQWAELLRLINSIGNESWSVDPLVCRILTSIGG
ncbi:ATP-binding protein [Planktothrix mougeotii]|uniref:AAA+ ATPase domain-containing protein n=1 Tax=Planktothrix mougeotii LEGE 06226 TaxID=1828728 RepID=A0ABR9UCA2_9CYAN|nr:hypothetical protein [Planktothrix mougeotii]MBE9144095.1 hypothetical protein [Planktothrix mougeotii LEGE 06226]